jgi:tetratricopeptide (TPR) repeat protein
MSLKRQRPSSSSRKQRSSSASSSTSTASVSSSSSLASSLSATTTSSPSLVVQKSKLNRPTIPRPPAHTSQPGTPQQQSSHTAAISVPHLQRHNKQKQYQQHLNDTYQGLPPPPPLSSVPSPRASPISPNCVMDFPGVTTNSNHAPSATTSSSKPKRGLSVVWRTPRPIIVSMLNNKGAIYIEREQYTEARKSLSRALRIAEKECNHVQQQQAHHLSSLSSHTTSEDGGVTTRARFRGILPMAPSLDVTATTTTSQQQEISTKTTTTTPPVSTSNFLRSCSLNAALLDDSGLSLVNPVDVFANVRLDNQNTSDGGFDHDNLVNLNSHGGEGSGTNPTSAEGNKQGNSSSSSTANKHRSEYDEGMDVFKSPFRLTDSSKSLDGTVLFNLGRVSHNLGNYDDALGLYKRSLLSLEKLPQRDEPLTLAILVCVGQIQYARGDHIDSLKTYMTALSLARSYFGEDTLEVAACLNCIGVLHYIMPSGDDAIALDALQTSLNLRLALLDGDHIDDGTTWNNVGRIFFQQGKYDRAMEAYNEALRIRRKCQGNSVDVAATLFNIGQVYHQQENRAKALSLYQEFLTLSKAHFGEYHRDICIVTTCIGQVSCFSRWRLIVCVFTALSASSMILACRL